ncbi:MAG: HAD family hydrolase [Planctomycetaceae bacterium]|nr:HAD family hydrolase [Planctomycetaceae bacterium]
MNRPSAILLDRDGTLIAERNYLADPAQVELLPNAVAGLLKMQQWGCPLIVITNQSGLGRGYFTQNQLDAVHAHLLHLLNSAGVKLAQIYVCPHAPDETCRCRKPLTGLVEQAVQDWRFDPRATVMIGDKACDVDLGLNVGARSLLVRTGYGHIQQNDPAVRPHAVVDDLLAAAEWIETELPR